MSMGFDDKNFKLPDDIDAQDMLTQILKRNDMEPNTVSLQEIHQKTVRRKRAMAILKVVCIGIPILIIGIFIFGLLKTPSSYSSEPVDIVSVDTTPPQVSDHYKNGDMLYLIYQDDIGIDYDSLQILSTSGEEITPISFDETSGTLCLTYPSETINIFISDLEGNRLQTVITIH